MWIRKYEQSGHDAAALVSKHAEHPKRERQKDEHARLISETIDDHYLALHGDAVITVYHDHYLPALKKLNKEHLGRGIPQIQPIAERSFYRRIADLNQYSVVEARQGKQAARQSFRMIKGHMPSRHPLDYVEIDHAQLSFWVVDDHQCLPLGRPWITAIKDRRTANLLGFYLSFRGPSLASIFGAIRHSLSPHNKLKAMWPDLEHDWVAWGPGAVYVSDRGSDYLCARYRAAIRDIGADYIYCRARTPWHKPHIERVFHSIHRDLLEARQGEVFRGLSYSRDYNPQRDAVVRFSTLVYLIVKWAVDYHPYKFNRSKRAHPIDLWIDGIQDAPIGYVPNPNALNIITGLQHTGSLGHEGIRFKHLNFSNSALEDLYRSRGLKSDARKVQFVVTEPDLGKIQVLDPRNHSWFDVECTRPDYASGLSLFQHQSLIRKANTDRYAIRDLDQLVRVRRQFQEQIADNLARKTSATKVKIARYLGIDSTSVLNQQPKSVADIQTDAPLANTTANDKTAADAHKLVIPDTAFIEVPSLAWGIVEQIADVRGRRCRPKRTRSDSIAVRQSVCGVRTRQ